jgi:hypothetical protein
MSPTIFKTGKYRFFFFSREEKRIHVHVTSPDGEAKFWIEPVVTLLKSDGLSKRQINLIQKIIEAHKDEIVKKWKRHFKA